MEYTYCVTQAGVSESSLGLTGPQAEGEGKLTLDLMLALFPPLLQLLPVIIQPLQTHDAILKTGSADTTAPEPGASVWLHSCPRGPNSVPAIEGTVRAGPLHAAQRILQSPPPPLPLCT